MQRGHSPKRRRKRLGHIEQDILNELTFDDLLVSFLVSGRSTKAYFRNQRERAMYRYRQRLALERLQRRGLIDSDGERACIRPAGRIALDYAVGSLKQKTEGMLWDGKWRILTFDIPERLRFLRDEMRSVLKGAGFVQLHQSLWVFPYDCAELVELLREETRLRKYVLYGVLESIEDDDLLKEKFEIKTGSTKSAN